MEEAAENGKESSLSARGNGMNEHTMNEGCTGGNCNVVSFNIFVIPISGSSV
jgi:hypothetical protein